MKFQALGTVQVVRDEQTVDLGPNKQRALLALLLVNVNKVVSTDQILDALWDDDGADRKASLQVHVSRLRTALEPDRKRGEASMLRTQEPGYILDIDAADYDVAEFDRLMSMARSTSEHDPAAAIAIFNEALAMWRGSAFEDFGYEQFAQAERTRLEDERIGAVEDRIDLDLTLGKSGELVSELEVLRDQHPLRERLVGQQMLALYRTGRPADALRAMGSFRRHIGEELGIDPTPSLLRLEEQILLNDDRIQGPSATGLSIDRSHNAVNPYKGLEPFTSEDSAAFFGRDTLIAELLRMLDSGESLVALVGASGSGKSSVIRAGLLPALMKGALPGSDGWLIASMTPGAHPFAELEAALLRSTITGPDSLTEQLEDADAAILRSVLRVLPNEGSRLVLVIDQFEELFNMVDDEAVQMRFLTNLVAALDDPHRRLMVVLTLRADFYGQPLRNPKFGARLGNGVINVTGLTSEELEAAAVEPAANAGVQFEPSLLAQLISDVGNQPGGLPLFQYALTELFDRRSGDALLISTYREMGGVDGAVQRRADQLFENLSADEQEAARQLFLRLVAVSEHDQRSRRRVTAREIASLGTDAVTVQATVSKLGEHRLLSFDSDRLSGAPTVEVAHEALLTAWPMLESWIDDSRQDLRRHASLVVALREWQLADEHPAYLLPAARLADFRSWQATSVLQLNSAERGYLDASSARLEAIEAERIREKQLAARGRRRLWSLVAALGGSLAVVALFMAGVFAPGPGPTITYFGQRNPDRVSDSIKSGMDRAADDLEMVLNDVRWTVDLVAEFEEFALSEPTFVIGDSSLHFESQIYSQYPDIRFGVVDPVEDDFYASLPNVSYVSFRNEEGAFLAGVAAASTTETGVVGFVGGMRIPLIEEFRLGFEAGVKAVDPDVEVLATFVSSSGDNGFANPSGGDGRATALYERGADVVFHAAGLSGQGIFRAADRFSDANNTHVWGIGVDVDQWFDFSTDLREHVLTSMVKRQDVAAHVLSQHFVNDGPAGLVAELGVAERGYAYTTSGNAMSVELIATLDHFVDEVSRGGITMPAEPTGEILRFDGSGNQVDDVSNSELFGTDFDEFSAVDEGTHQVSSLGIPLSVEVEGIWHVQVNMLGHTVFSHPDSRRMGDRDLVFLRPSDFADPTRPGEPPDLATPWPATEMNGLDGFDEWLVALDEGIISGEPSRVVLAGRDAVYFEVELSNDYECGSYGYCAGFLINVITSESGISGWAFEPGFHQRIWVVDGGEHPPLVVVASTPSDDRTFQSVVDDFLDRITIGEPGPHPLDRSETVAAEQLVGTWIADSHPFKVRFNVDGTYVAALTEERMETSPAESGEWTLEEAVLTLDTKQSQCPGILDRPGSYRIWADPTDADVITLHLLDDPCLGRIEGFSGPHSRE